MWRPNRAGWRTIHNSSNPTQPVGQGGIDRQFAARHFVDRGLVTIGLERHKSLRPADCVQPIAHFVLGHRIRVHHTPIAPFHAESAAGIGVGRSLPFDYATSVNS
jgi:hypothetical protein